MTSTILITGATGLIGFRVLLTVLSASHTVRCTVRSKSKAKTVSSNPAIEKLSPGERLSFVIVPDICADGAYDAAVEGISHVIHAGSPVPVPGRDPEREVYQPIVKSTMGLLESALRTPSVQRIVITSSVIANLSPTPDPTRPPPPTTASSRIQLDTPPSPSSFAHVFEAYHLGKLTALNYVDTFTRTHHPRFSITHVLPGYVFGRNELATDANSMRTENSSNNLLMAMLTGTEHPAPIGGSAAHIDDVADVHLRLLLPSLPGADPSPQDFAVSTPVVYDDAFDYVAARFPKAVAEGVFVRGKLPTLAVAYDAGETEEKVLGREFRSFKSAVLDIAEQYLELLGKEMA
jgi:nucleoside-diphosphate-sugar epimerase